MQLKHGAKKMNDEKFHHIKYYEQIMERSTKFKSDLKKLRKLERGVQNSMTIKSNGLLIRET